MIIDFNGGSGSGGGSCKLEHKDYNITENGTTPIVPSEGFDGIFEGDITVDVQPALQEKTVEIKANAVYEYTPDEGFYGISKLNVNAQIEATGSALNVAGTGWENGEAVFPVSIARAGTLEDDLNYTRQKFSEWDPSATSLNNIFSNDENLVYAPKINMSNLTTIGGMFFGCSNLTLVPQFDTSKITSMRQMFYGCKSLTTIPQLDTSKITSMRQVFTSCSSLTSVPQLDCGKVNDTKELIWGCGKITYLGGFLGLKKSIQLYHSKIITHQSLLNVIAGLGQADPSFEAQPKLSLGQTNLDKLTAEEIAVGTAKGWQIVA